VVVTGSGGKNEVYLRRQGEVKFLPLFDPPGNPAELPVPDDSRPRADGGKTALTPKARPVSSFLWHVHGQKSSALIFPGARIVLNPQRLDGSETLRVGTTRAPAFGFKFKLRHYRQKGWLDGIVKLRENRNNQNAQGNPWATPASFGYT
jgi:hypothetical protein